MPDDTHPTRTLLLEAGLALAESASLAATSVDQVVRAAGVSKGTFYVHFKDRDSYLAALHRAFYRDLGTQIGQVMAAHPPGAERLRRGVVSYLDACLRSRGVKAMLLDVRSEAAIAAQIRVNIAAFAEVLADDYAALQAPDPAGAARLFIAMVHEVALAELAAGGADPALRHALWYLGRVHATAGKIRS